jgi:choline dehydrogenase-like flavoprotein
MDIFEDLAVRFADARIEATTFSIDALGRQICSTWADVEKANASPFDVVIIGAGMFGGYCAEKLYRRDRSKTLRILVLDAGALFLPTHQQNLPISQVPVPVWSTPWTGNKDYVDGSGLAYCIGGRSLHWAGWAPELTANDLKEWPAEVRQFLTSPKGYDRTAAEIGVSEPTRSIEETRLYERLYKVFQKTQPNVPNVTSIDRAPLAVMGSPPTPGIFPFDKFSSVTLLIDALNADSANAERRLMLLPRTEVIGLTLDGKRVKSLELKVGRDPKTYDPRFNKEKNPKKWDVRLLQLGDNTTVVLANGTIEATRLALANLGVGEKGKKGKDGRLKVGNFMTHMTNSISVRIKRTALGLGAPSQSENEVAAFMARGEVEGRAFHYQIVSASLQNPNSPNETPWDHMLKMVPDIDQLDQLRSQHDPEYVTIVFRGVAEMEGYRDLDKPDNWLNWIGLENDGDPRTRASANLGPSLKDKALWKAMDKVAIDWAKQLAPDSKDIQWQNKTGKERWTDVPLDPNSTEQFHDGIGSSHHEGGTLFMGDKDNKDKSITDTDGKFHDLNVYVVGPAVFPTIGDANPSLTGLTLARRTADAILALPRQGPLVA